MVISTKMWLLFIHAAVFLTFTSPIKAYRGIPHNQVKALRLKTSPGSYFNRNPSLLNAAPTPGNIYVKALSKRPLLTKCSASALAFLLGDILAQRFVGQAFSMVRAIRMALFGLAVFAPLSHTFYRQLERKFPGRDAKSVTVKIILDQTLLAPLM